MITIENDYIFNGNKNIYISQEIKEKSELEKIKWALIQCAGRSDFYHESFYSDILTIAKWALDPNK